MPRPLPGALVGRWWFVSIVALVLTLIGLFLWANDDWYGAGGGDFGIELNLFAAAPASFPLVGGIADIG